MRLLAISGLAALIIAAASAYPDRAHAQMTVTPGGSVQVNADTTTTATINLDGANASSDDEFQVWDNGTPITASTDGIHAVTGDGLALVETGGVPASISMVNAAGSSISSSIGTGLTLTGNGGGVSYSGGGAIFGNTGLSASEIGSGTVTVESSGGIFGAAGDGIDTSAVDGDTLVTIDGATVQGSTGFAGLNSSASGAGNLIVVINSGFVGGDTGISLNQTGTGSNTITNFGTIAGLGTAANPVIAIATTNSGTSTITNNGTIIVPNCSDIEILLSVTTGGDQIINVGSLTGQILLSNQANSLTNSATWNVSDNAGSGFDAAAFGSSGANVLTNDVGGVINAGAGSPNSTFTGIETINNFGKINAGASGPGVTTFAAGAGFTQTVTNMGIINVNGTANFEGDATFLNSGGLIDMRTGAHATTDVTALNVAVGSGAASNTYVGIATTVSSSQLGVETFVGGVASTGANVPSDRLLISGAATGTTGILVNDTAVSGAYNPVGITLVAVNGASSNAFSLQGLIEAGSDGILQPTRGPMGAIKKDYFFYPLLQTPHATAVADGLSGPNSSEYRLYGLPDVEAFQTPLAITGAQNIWYETVLGWNERQDELRKHWPEVYGAASAEGEGKFSLWAQATGSWGNRSNANSPDPFTPVPGLFPSFDTSFSQQIYSVQIGTDVGFNNVFDKDGVLVLGTSLGYVDSVLGFNTSVNKFNYSGVTLGVTTDLLIDGWFWDTAFKADLLQAKLNFGSLASFGPDRQSVEADTYGILSSTGFHFDLESAHENGPAAFFEPLLTLAYTTGTLGQFTALGTTARFNASNTFRGALGARVGDEWVDDESMTLDASIAGNYWDEFTNNTGVTLLTGPPAPALLLRDVREKAYGEVVGELNLTDKESGLFGYINGGAKFNSQFTSVEIKTGVTYK
jgi:outer membrane autotransporter protein